MNWRVGYEIELLAPVGVSRLDLAQTIAKENGAQLVILNREPTDLDSLADLVLNLEIGPTLGEAANVN